MNIRQAQSLKPGDIVHFAAGYDNCFSIRKDKPAVVARFRVSGRPKLWKRDPYRVRVPVKYGLYYSTAITENDLDDWHLEDECPLRSAEAAVDIEILTPEGDTIQGGATDI